jgi:hypothetical protein
MDPEPIRWPATHDELLAAGWSFVKTTPCRGQTCLVTIQWFQSPSGRRAPLELTGDGRYTSHFAKCPAAREFRRAR